MGVGRVLALLYALRRRFFCHAAAAPLPMVRLPAVQQLRPIKAAAAAQ